MYFEDYDKHHKPHIHARYNDNKATYDLEANKISGNIPPKQEKLIQEWIQIHKEELNSLWILMKEEKKYFKIKPLS